MTKYRDLNPDFIRYGLWGCAAAIVAEASRERLKSVRVDSANLHGRGPFPTQLRTTIVAVESWEGTPMPGGLTRACAMASAFFALIFFAAVTFGAFTPPARSMADKPHIAQGR
jgi:hypothetical protein